jgi:molybdopterin molybdotransferase
VAGGRTARGSRDWAVPVVRLLQVAVVATGSELCPAGYPLRRGEVYDSNGPMLAALLAEPSTVVASLKVRDDLNAVTEIFERFAGSADLFITTGGISVGEEDHVRDAFLRAGGRLEIVKVAMKPGKPVVLGKLRETCFVGLSGNSQAAAFGAIAFARPIVTALLGQEPAKRLMSKLVSPTGRNPIVPNCCQSVSASLRGASLRIAAGPTVPIDFPRWCQLMRLRSWMGASSRRARLWSR